METKIGYVAIEITEEEAQEFVWFRKNYLNLRKILQSGILDIKSGRAVLSFDDRGYIGTIKTISIKHYPGA